MQSQKHQNHDNRTLEGRLEFFRSTAIHSPFPNADFQEDNLRAIYASGVNYAPSNGVMEKQKCRLIPEEEIDRTIHFFQEKNLPFIWWSSDKNLKEKGFVFGGTLTGISLNTTTLPTIPSTSLPYTVKVVQSNEDLEAFSRLMSDSFGLSTDATKQMHAILLQTMQQKEQLHLLAYLGEEPIGTVTLSTCKHSAGIWNLSTDQNHRRQGVGSLLCYTAIQEAKKRDYSKVIAVLMPKGEAWGLFASLGFIESYLFPFYIYGAEAHELEK